MSTAGSYALWEMPDVSYVDVIDTVGSVVVDRSNLGEAMIAAISRSDDGAVPTVGIDGREAHEPTTAVGDRRDPTPGSVVSLDARPYDGVFEADVIATRPASVVLRSSFHPRWRVRVDDQRAVPHVVAPGFVAVTVDEGEHRVVFRYEPYGQHALWLGIAVLALIVLRRRSSPRRFVTRRRVRA